MSILYCHTSDFLLRLHRDGEQMPLLLVDGAGQVAAVSQEARRLGVETGMKKERVTRRWPTLPVTVLNASLLAEAQASFSNVLAQTELPVEPSGWGSGYVDLTTLSRERAQVAPVCAELGRQMRRILGKGLVPSLGWDSGKFTARVAAVETAPGRLRLVDHGEETAFLSKQPVRLLPLPPDHLQQLGWLGIHTLGQFAALPEVAVWRRFGKAGKQAWRWSQGWDTRPVVDGLSRPPQRLVQLFEPGIQTLSPLMSAAERVLTPRLTKLHARFQAIQSLTITLSGEWGPDLARTFTFAQPIDIVQPFLLRLTDWLTRRTFAAPVTQLTLILDALSEAPLGQATLFPELAKPDESPLAAVRERLVRRHGPVVFQAAVTEAEHPVAERRGELVR